MAAGLGLLRLSPKEFWAMTLREFDRAMSVFAPDSAGAPARGELAELMRAFPDVIPRGDLAWLKR